MEQKKDARKEIDAIRKDDTKNKMKWLGNTLGIQVSVYIDKYYGVLPDEILLKLKDEE